MSEKQFKDTEMQETRTNKKVLFKGIKQLIVSIVFMFVGPSIIYLALSNKEKDMYIVLVIIGFLGCIAAIYFAFKGLSAILESIFQNMHSKK